MCCIGFEKNPPSVEFAMFEMRDGRLGTGWDVAGDEADIGAAAALGAEPVLFSEAIVRFRNYSHLMLPLLGERVSWGFSVRQRRGTVAKVRSALALSSRSARVPNATFGSQTSVELPPTSIGLSIKKNEAQVPDITGFGC